MNEAWVPITPNPRADFRTQVLTLVERLVLAAEENEPLSFTRLPLQLELPVCMGDHCMGTQMLQNSHIWIWQNAYWIECAWYFLAAQFVKLIQILNSIIFSLLCDGVWWWSPWRIYCLFSLYHRNTDVTFTLFTYHQLHLIKRGLQSKTCQKINQQKPLLTYRVISPHNSASSHHVITWSWLENAFWLAHERLNTSGSES